MCGLANVRSSNFAYALPLQDPEVVSPVNIEVEQVSFEASVWRFRSAEIDGTNDTQLHGVGISVNPLQRRAGCCDASRCHVQK